MGFKGFFIFYLTLLSTGLLNAQSDFTPAYIIKHSADTLYGEVDNRGDLIMGKTCKFKSQEGSIYEYSPNEITAFRFIDSKYYVSREVNGKNVFLQYLVNGEVDLYYLRDHEGDHYFLDKEDKKLFEIPYEEKFKYKNGKKYLYQSKKHIGVLNVYMQDAPAFQSRIEKIKKPEYRKLIKLAEDYHYSVCKGEKCIVYKQKQPIKIHFEIVGGSLILINTETPTDNIHTKFGFLLHIGIPRINEKIYFKTGFLYSPSINTTRKGITKDYKIPLHIGYLAPNTLRIRPSISIGMFSTSYSAGLMLKVNKKMHIGVQSWLDFENGSIIWVPSKLNSYSILGSIFIKL